MDSRTPFFRLIAVLTGASLVLQMIVLYNSRCRVMIHDRGRSVAAVEMSSQGNRRIETTPSVEYRSSTSKKFRDALVFPVPNITRRYLTIGIPTISRQNASYLLTTLKSIFDKTPEMELRDIAFVVFLADFDSGLKLKIATDLRDNFYSYIARGALHVINVPMTFYPSLEGLKRTFGDEERRVKWRSKQNYDYAFLMEYSKDLSSYYMQMEDDVVVADGYFPAIKDFIRNQSDDNWVCLEFSELGFIGKLYHSRDLSKLAELLKLFFQEQPVDYLYLYFNTIMTQSQRRIRKPTLFQHTGLTSSFTGRIQGLQDRFFNLPKKNMSGNNPPAKLFTTMMVNNDFAPRFAYENKVGYFWSAGAPKVNDTFTVVFDEPQRLEKVIVLTGTDGHRDDVIEHGILEASLTLLDWKENKFAKCSNDILLVEFKHGVANATSIGQKMGEFKARCLRITLTKPQMFWVIIREIAISVK